METRVSMNKEAELGTKVKLNLFSTILSFTVNKDSGQINVA